MPGALRLWKLLEGKTGYMAKFEEDTHFRAMVQRLYEAMPWADLPPTVDGQRMWGDVEGCREWYFCEAIAREVVNATNALEEHIQRLDKCILTLASQTANPLGSAFCNVATIISDSGHPVVFTPSVPTTRNSGK